jgi:uncharacterized membrane protein YvbJ
MNSIRCPECGLVNFATATECKRCHLSFEFESAPADNRYGNAQDQNTQNHHWPQIAAEQQNKKRLFSGIIVVLTGLLAVAVVVFVIQKVFHPFDPETGKAVALVFVFVALPFMCVCGILTLVKIFEQSVGWGLASLFIPFAGLVAVGQFWEETRRPFVGWMICYGIVLVGGGIGF